MSAEKTGIEEILNRRSRGNTLAQNVGGLNDDAARYLKTELAQLFTAVTQAALEAETSQEKIDLAKTAYELGERFHALYGEKPKPPTND